MRSLILRFALLICLVAPAAYAQQAIPVPAPPELGAPAYIMLDFNSGRVLAEKNADERRDPASLTKMMTAYAVFHELKAGNLKLTDEITISEKAWRAEGSRTFVEVGKKVPVEILIKGLIIQSGNDASIALAEHIAGNEETFARLMNQYAKSLGMTGTQYMNATGLPHPEHYSTARDEATLARAILTEFPEYHHWHSEKQYSYNGITQYNRNKLLWRDESVDGLKTGHTEAAGYCLAATALRDGMRLISVVMGARDENDRASQTQALLNYGFRFFETHRLYQASAPLATPRIWKGAAETLPLGLDQDLWVTIPRQQYDRLQASMVLEPLITAPVSTGARLGQVVVKLGEQTVSEVPLVALSAVDEGGLWRRLVDGVLLKFE